MQANPVLKHMDLFTSILELELKLKIKIKNNTFNFSDLSFLSTSS